MPPRGRTKQPVPSEASPAAEVEPQPRDRGKSLVFISHDNRDGVLAQAFATMLASVSAGMLKSFRSSNKKEGSGIGFGEEWYTTIMSRLGDATDVVALLTPQSVDRPWILYEAGVAKGKLDTVVLGVALGVPLERVSTGPFGQFQNCSDDEDSLTALVLQLLSRNPDASPLEDAVRMQVQLFKQKVNDVLEKSGSPDAGEVEDEQSAAKLFEEVKAMVRELPDRVEGRVRSVARRGSLRGSRLNPIMFDRMLFSGPLREIGDRRLSWLIFMSLIRDDLPWLYEAGMDVYRSLSSRSRNSVDRAIKAFQQLTQVTLHSGIFRDFMSEDKEAYFMMRHVPEISERLFYELLETRDAASDLDLKR